MLWLGTFWHCVYSAYIFLVRLRKGAVAMILFRFFYNFERFRFNQVFFSLRGNTQYTVYALKTISEIQFSRFVVERGSLIYSIIITKETL